MIVSKILTELFERFRSVRAELLWIAFGHAAAFAGGLAGIKILTNILGTSGYGELALGLAIAGFLTTFLHNPVSNSAARFYASYLDTGKALVYFSALLSIHKKLLFILSPVILISIIIVRSLKGSAWSVLLAGGAGFGIVSGIGVSLLAWQNATRDRRGATIAQIGDVFLRIGFGILAAVMFGTGRATIAGYIAGTSLIVCWQILKVVIHRQKLEKVEPLPSSEQVNAAVNEFTMFALPFVMYALFTVAALYADRWIIQITSGAAAVGIYAALFQIASSPVNLLFAVVNQLMTPVIYERSLSIITVESRASVRKVIGQTVFAVSCISLLGTVLTAVVSRKAVSLLTTDLFADYSDALWKIVLGLALWQIAQLMALEGICANRPGIYFWPKGLHALTLISSGYYLVSVKGINGMAMALIVSSMVYIISVGVVNIRLEHQLRRLA